jgi:hypothetical protein
MPIDDASITLDRNDPAESARIVQSVLDAIG